VKENIEMVESESNALSLRACLAIYRAEDLFSALRAHIELDNDKLVSPCVSWISSSETFSIRDLRSQAHYDAAGRGQRKNEEFNQGGLMQAYRVETTVQSQGELTLRNLPLPEGEKLRLSFWFNSLIREIREVSAARQSALPL